MPSLSERSRNNIRAGVFVTVSLIVCVGVVVAIADLGSAFGQASHKYAVMFSVSEGVGNLKPGSDVRIGGVRMGRVTAVDPQLNDETLNEILVRFTTRVKLFGNAKVIASSPLIGSDSWLDIPAVGSADQPLAADAILKGTPSSGMLSTFLGPHNQEQIDSMIEDSRLTMKDIRAFGTFVGSFGDEYQSRVVPILDNAAALTADVREVTNDLRDNRWEQWAASIDHVMKWGNEATGRIDEVFANGSGLFADARDVIAENREPVKATLANLKDVSATVNTETIDLVHRFLDTGQQGLDHARGVLETLRVDYAKWATAIDESMANLSLTAQQLKLASIETRRSPWKLLYRPSSDELQHEFLYEAARSFAMAAADLKASSEATRRILDHHGAAIAGNEELYRRLEQSLRDSLSKYEKAQQNMLDILVSDRQP